MEPLGVIAPLVSLTRYLVDVADTVHQSSEECQRLAKRADEIVGLIQNECMGGVPVDLEAKLVKLSK